VILKDYIKRCVRGWDNDARAAERPNELVTPDMPKKKLCGKYHRQAVIGVENTFCCDDTSYFEKEVVAFGGIVSGWEDACFILRWDSVVFMCCQTKKKLKHITSPRNTITKSSLSNSYL
jgi:hypothetical protein